MSRRRKPPELCKLLVLEGARLRLRAPQPHDAAAIYAYARDPGVTRLLAWPTHTSLADSERFLQEALAGWRSGRDLVWLIEDAAGVVGAIGAELGGANAGVGYVLARDRWGRGYATEALRLLVDALFQHTAIDTVWALCVTQNAASQRVLEKSGFDRQRTMARYHVCPNLGGEKQDVWLFARERGSL